MDTRKLARRIGLGLAAYTLLARPRILRWGATKEEVQEDFPGKELIPGGSRTPTMAVTLDAPPADVWPWLLQMGDKRGGWYSWDLLDNFGKPSADRIHPEWQNVKVGDVLNGMGVPSFEVAALDAPYFLAFRASFDMRGRRYDPSHGRPRFFSDSLWAFQLKELPEGKTRLVVSGYWARNPRWLHNMLNFAFLEWAHWIMEMRQMQNLKRLTAA